MTISPVTDARKPILPWMAGADGPAQPFSRRNPQGVAIFPRPDDEQIGDGALLIQVLLPESRHPPGTAFARQARAAGSEPASGSVRPKQPTRSPTGQSGQIGVLLRRTPRSARSPHHEG